MAGQITRPEARADYRERDERATSGRDAQVAVRATLPRPPILDELTARLHSIFSALRDLEGRATSLGDRLLGPVPQCGDGGTGAEAAGNAKTDELFYSVGRIDDVVSALSAQLTRLEAL